MFNAPRAITILTVPSKTVAIDVTQPKEPDREDTFLFYRSIANFCEYILVRQTIPSIDRYTRQESGWWLQEFSGLEASLPIEVIGLDMPLAEIYRGVNLDD